MILNQSILAVFERDVVLLCAAQLNRLFFWSCSVHTHRRQPSLMSEGNPEYQNRIKSV
jgi:hypothetical protein